MFNVIVTFLGVLVDCLVAVAKKLVGLAFLLALIVLTTFATLTLVLIQQFR